MKLFDAITDAIAIGGLLLFMVLTATAHAATTATAKHSNSLGTVQYQDNPNTYKAGSVSVVGFIDDSINFRLQPLATYGLFTEDILFCDKQKLVKMFDGKHQPLLLTYKTRASHLVRGLGCHELVRVDELARPALPQELK